MAFFRLVRETVKPEGESKRDALDLWLEGKDPAERRYYHLADSKSNYILSWCSPWEFPPEDKECFECANGAYVKNMSITAGKGRIGNIYLTSYFIFSDVGLQRAQDFVRKNQKKGKENELCYGKAGDSFFKVLHFPKTGDTTLLLDTQFDDCCFEQKPVLEIEYRGHRKPRPRIVETADQTNEVFYRTLKENYQYFKHVIM